MVHTAGGAHCASGMRAAAQSSAAGRAGQAPPHAPQQQQPSHAAAVPPDGGASSRRRVRCEAVNRAGACAAALLRAYCGMCLCVSLLLCGSGCVVLAAAASHPLLGCACRALGAPQFWAYSRRVTRARPRLSRACDAPTCLCFRFPRCAPQTSLLRNCVSPSRVPAARRSMVCRHMDFPPTPRRSSTDQARAAHAAAGAAHFSVPHAARCVPHFCRIWRRYVRRLTRTSCPR
jgi:hypothetical protein